ncbi:uncharacterized protein LOC143577296 [Bidens hawaiensis]|uniref:uncharacterized protein LOC143577296 n=1 Tax=Bidens hawaiensis TaxID=980011 RepID=UPI00404B6EB8
MLVFIHITLEVATAGLFLLLFFLFKHFQSHPKPPQQANGHLTISGRVTSSKHLFNWSDHPTLVPDAIENGWSRFAFTEYVSSSSTRSNRFLLGSLGSCVAGDVDDVETSWEVCPGSADSMQKIRLNSGLVNNIKTTCSVIKSALPLPGPTLGNSYPFPQEAYFEITILSGCENEGGFDVNVKGRVNSGEGENIKLIQEHGLDVRDLHVNVEELRGRSCTKEIVEGVVMMSVGLTGGGSLPVKLPGSYPGSVGFNSDGSIYLDGIKLVSESNIERWERSDKVIGCGYNPSQKKVFFKLL